jgi:hypothetical protein
MASSLMVSRVRHAEVDAAAVLSSVEEMAVGGVEAVLDCCS